jgi:hypothetical protein
MAIQSSNFERYLAVFVGNCSLPNGNYLGLLTVTKPLADPTKPKGNGYQYAWTPTFMIKRAGVPPLPLCKLP